MKMKQKYDLVPIRNKVKTKGGDSKCQSEIIKQSKLIKVTIASAAYHQRI